MSRLFQVTADVNRQHDLCFVLSGFVGLH